VAAASFDVQAVLRSLERLSELEPERGAQAWRSEVQRLERSLCNLAVANGRAGALHDLTEAMADPGWRLANRAQDLAEALRRQCAEARDVESAAAQALTDTVEGRWRPGRLVFLGGMIPALVAALNLEDWAASFVVVSLVLFAAGTACWIRENEVQRLASAASRRSAGLKELADEFAALHARLR